MIKEATWQDVEEADVLFVVKNNEEAESVMKKIIDISNNFVSR